MAQPTEINCEEAKKTYDKMLKAFANQRNYEALDLSQKLLDNPHLSEGELSDVRHVYSRTKDIAIYS